MQAPDDVHEIREAFETKPEDLLLKAMGESRQRWRQCVRNSQKSIQTGKRADSWQRIYAGESSNS